MADQLSIKPENHALDGEGSYHLYCGEIFDLVVTLTLAEGTTDLNECVSITPLRDDHPLQTYGGIEGGSFDEDTMTVTLKLEPTDDPHVWQARVQLLALGTIGKRDYIEAQLCSDSVVKEKMWFVQFQPYESAPVVVDDFYLPMANEDAWQPSTVQGRFVHYRFAVADDTTLAPLERILVRVTTMPADATILDVALYDRYDATEPLSALKVHDTWYVDLQTDAEGMAELFLCAKRSGRSAGGQLKATVGTRSREAGSFLVADLNESDSSLGAPYIVGGHVQVDAHTGTLPVSIDRYENPAVGDTIFLFCNGVYQSSGTILDLAWFNSPQLRIEPYNLHSTGLDDAAPNTLQYCVLRTTGTVRVSSVNHFDVIGIPPTPTPEVPLGDGPKPELLEAPEHGIVNCHTLADGGLHVRVVLGAEGLHPVSPGVDTLKLKLYVSGYRADSEAPKGAIMEGPDDFTIMQADIDRGHIVLWFPARLFLGYGRKKSNAQAGAFQAQYVVMGKDTRKATVKSPPLALGLDTIAPGETGVDDAARRSTSAGAAQTRTTA